MFMSGAHGILSKIAPIAFCGASLQHGNCLVGNASELKEMPVKE